MSDEIGRLIEEYPIEPSEDPEDLLGGERILFDEENLPPEGNPLCITHQGEEEASRIFEEVCGEQGLREMRDPKCRIFIRKVLRDAGVE